MIDNMATLDEPLINEEPKEEVVGLTATGTEIKAPKTPATNLELGSYYRDQIPGNMTASWESNAEKQAGLKFQENVAKSEASMLRSRQEMQEQGEKMQTQLSLGEYMREQSAEKAGWTGGYMLDQARQGEFLKSTIQAQLYGQQELQKFGMESQLEAARLAYDLGKEQLALQYYNEAYQKALTEAQMFGYYVSPETRDMFNQYQAALKTLEANPEDENAARIKTTVENFYKDENLTEADLRKYSTATFEMQQYMEGKLEAALALIDEDPSKFIVKDSNGNYALDANNRYVMLDFDDVSSTDLMAFLNTDNAEGTSKTSDSAVKSYMRYLGQSTINGYFSSLEEGTVPTNEGFVAWLQDNPSLLNEWFKSTIGEDDKADFFNQVGKEVTATLAGPDGSLTVKFNLENNTITVGEQTEEVINNNNEEGTEPTDTNNPFSITYNYTQNPETVMDNYKTVYQDYWKVNGKDPLSFNKMVSEYEYLYGSSYFKNTSEFAVQFEKDLNTYYKVINGKYNTSMGDTDYKSIDDMVQALTVIKQDGFMDTNDIYRDLLTQTINSKIGLNLTGKIEVHNEAPASGTTVRNRGFKVKLSSLSATEKAKLLGIVKTSSIEQNGYLIFRTQQKFGDVQNRKVAVGESSDAYAYRTILFNILKGQ